MASRGEKVTVETPGQQIQRKGINTQSPEQKIIVNIGGDVYGVDQLVDKVVDGIKRKAGSKNLQSTEYLNKI